jgi:hypothetical protein
VEQDLLGKRGLARIDMRDDADVANVRCGHDGPR